MYSSVIKTLTLIAILKIFVLESKYIVYPKYIHIYGLVNLGVIHALFKYELSSKDLAG